MERAIGGELCLDRLEEGAIENGLVFADVHRTTVEDFADVEAVAKKLGDRANAETNAAADFTIGKSLTTGSDFSAVQVLGQIAD